MNRSNTLKNVGEIIADLTGPELVEVGVETGLSFLAPGGAGRRVHYLYKGSPNRIGSVRADEANAFFVERGMKPPYATNVRPRNVILKTDTTFVRVHGENNQARSWIMRPKEIEGLTPLEIQEKFALPNTPEYVSEVHLPAGSYVRVGRVATQDGWGAGGAMQYQYLEQVPKKYFKNMRLITTMEYQYKWGR